MNALQKRKHPLDQSADWIGHTVGNRLQNCIFQLSLFGIIDDQTAVSAFGRLNTWIDAKYHNSQQGDDTSRKPVLDILSWRCPNCENGLVTMEAPSVCPHCSQRLDWSE